MDPQEKWLSARRRWYRRRQRRMRGADQKVGYWFFKELPPPYYFHPLPPHLQWKSMLEKGRVALAPVRINIIHVINIKITLLCFVSGSEPRQLKGPVPTDGCFRPCFLSAPPSLAIYWDHNLLWWVFRVLFCQGQSGLSNKWSRWSGGGLAPATHPTLLLFSKWHTWPNLYFESFVSIAFVLDTRKNSRRKRGWQRCKEWVSGFNWAGDCIGFLTLTFPTKQGWGNNTNKDPCSQN